MHTAFAYLPSRVPAERIVSSQPRFSHAPWSVLPHPVLRLYPNHVLLPSSLLTFVTSPFAPASKCSVLLVAHWCICHPELTACETLHRLPQSALQRAWPIVCGMSANGPVFHTPLAVNPYQALFRARLRGLTCRLPIVLPCPPSSI